MNAIGVDDCQMPFRKRKGLFVRYHGGRSFCDTDQFNVFVPVSRRGRAFFAIKAVKDKRESRIPHFVFFVGAHKSPRDKKVQ